MLDVIVLIPARLKSSRLPNKLLLDVNGKTVFDRVCENVKKSIHFDVCVAHTDVSLDNIAKKYGFLSVLTDPSLPSGTDRIASALMKIDPKSEKYSFVVNFQGDGINVNPKIIPLLIELIKKYDCDIATCGVVFRRQEDILNPSNVKIVMGLQEGMTDGRALYFTRSPTCPYIRDPMQNKKYDIYHHIGIYVYKISALKKITSLPVGVLEDMEKLEQLRALENDMIIRAKIVSINDVMLNNNSPLDINTIEDLELARKFIK